MIFRYQGLHFLLHDHQYIKYFLQLGLQDLLLEESVFGRESEQIDGLKSKTNLN